MVITKTKDLGHVQTYLGPELGRLVRLLAADEGMTITAWLSMVIRDYINRLNAANKKEAA